MPLAAQAGFRHSRKAHRPKHNPQPPHRRSGGDLRLNSTTRFALRMTVAAVGAFFLGRVLAVPLHGIWAVLTAVIVTQASVGGSIGASLNYVLGTLVGAIYASFVALLIPHTTQLATAGVLALSIAPLAYAAALSNVFRVAPFTAVIVLLLAGQFGQGPLAAAATRLLEVVLGGAVAVLVSLVLFPEQAYRRAKQAAVLSLEQLAHALPLLLAGVSAKLNAGDVQRIQDNLGSIVASFGALVAETKHEQTVTFRSRPDVGPLSRTLLRLRHDLVIIGRAASLPLPEVLLRKLSPRISAIAATVGDFLLASANALDSDRSPPSAAQLDVVMNAYSSEVATMRAADLTQALSADKVEQLFTLGFALDQMRNDLTDLERCVREWMTV
jgi:Fusaric acid resistance protein-like